jgi:hypothetical protein
MYKFVWTLIINNEYLREVLISLLDNLEVNQYFCKFIYLTSLINTYCHHNFREVR